MNINGITLAGTDAGNYNLVSSTASTSANIDPKSVSIAGVQAANKVYDGKTQAEIVFNNATLAGTIPSDAVSIGAMSANFLDANAGLAQPVSIDLVTLAGADARNYVVEPLARTFATISQRPLSTWIGTGNGLWSDPLNWDVIPNGLNVLSVSLPAGTGSVTLDQSAGSVTLNSLVSSRNLVVSGGSLQLSGGLTTTALIQSGGSLGGAGVLRISEIFNQTGGSATFGSVDAIQTQGDMNVHTINASSVVLSAASGAIRQAEGGIRSASLTTNSTAGAYLNATGNQLRAFNGTNRGSGNIELVNTGVLKLDGVLAEGGSIKVVNTGGVETTVLVSARDGSVSLTANSPLTIGAPGVKAGGDINLIATNLTSEGNIILEGPIESTSGGVALSAASNLTQNSSILAPLGVSVAAGGAFTFGPLATSGYQPVVYKRNGQPVSPPLSSLSGNIATDQVVSLMQSASSLLGDSITNPVETLLRQEKERDLSKELIVSEGQICRP